LDDPITTKDQHTGAGAAIFGDIVAVIAGLIAFFALRNIGPHHRITAGCHRTVVETRIAVERITIVAGLKTQHTQRQVCSHDAVTACSDLTVSRTAIFIDGIAIVALLIGVDGAVAARGPTVTKPGLIAAGECKDEAEDQEVAKEKHRFAHHDLLIQGWKFGRACDQGQAGWFFRGQRRFVGSVGSMPRAKAPQ
jgi:hypothetical protein